MNQQEILALIKLISNSLLISELVEQTSITTDSNYLMMNKGSDDAKKVKIPLLRGYLGGYNASTNTPSLSNGVGVNGDTYTVSVAGDRNFGNGTISLIVDDVIWYNGDKWVKLTQSQISDISGLQSELQNKANINGSEDFTFKVSDAEEDNQAVNLGQLKTFTTNLNVGESFYIDSEGLLRSNISVYRQTINYTSGNQIFTLDFEPTFFISIFVNGVYLDQSEYTYNSPNSLTILGVLESGDVIKIIYEHFIQNPE